MTRGNEYKQRAVDQILELLMTVVPDQIHEWGVRAFLDATLSPMAEEIDRLNDHLDDAFDDWFERRIDMED